MQGKNIGRYHILEPLGEGGMAQVYKAIDLQLDRDVAIKFLRTDSKNIEVNRKRFEIEAKSLAKLKHPNIVTVLDFGEFEGQPYLVMEYIEGGSLKEQAFEKLTWRDAAVLLVPIADALSYAHDQKIVHRDVKPANILITKDGRPLLTDFGVAKLLESEDTLDLTGTSVGIGTPAYLAPEQGHGKSIDHRSDMYALGIVFYELVTGRKPFQADTPFAVVLKHMSDPLPSPREFGVRLPGNVENFLFRILAKDPGDRFKDLNEVHEFLKAFASGGKVRIKHKKQKKAMPYIVGFAIVLMAGGVLFAWPQIIGLFHPPTLTENSTIQPTQELEIDSQLLGTEIVSIAEIEEIVEVTETPAVAPTPIEQVNSENEGITYLAELEPVFEYVGIFDLSIGAYSFDSEEDFVSEGDPIFAHGDQYQFGLFAHAPSSVVYRLDGDYEKFTAIILMSETISCGDGAEFIILLDDEEIYHSDLMFGYSSPKFVELNVEGGQILELATSIGNNGHMDCDWTIWGDPYLKEQPFQGTRYDFDDPTYDGVLNQSELTKSGDCANVWQEEGALVFNNQDNSCDLFTSIYSFDSIQKISFKAKLSEISNDIVTQEIVFRTEQYQAEEFLDIFFGLRTDSNRAYAFCSAFHSEDSSYITDFWDTIPINVDTWYDISISVNHEEKLIYCYIDDQIFATGNLPYFSDLSGLYFKLLLESARPEGGDMLTYLDYVEIRVLN
ncbi:protein kinase [bacterium]|nr:protein kinase [bacterium]